jgi:hypothetical protein
MPLRSSEVLADQQQINLLYKLMNGSAACEGDTDEAKMCRHLICEEYARPIQKQGERHVIATLRGAALFRRHYNAVTQDEAFERHQQYLRTHPSLTE